MNQFDQMNMYNPNTIPSPGYRNNNSLNLFGMGYQPPTTALQTPITVPTVNGREGANAYSMPPNSTVLLLDANQPIVWFKQTDGGGYATVKGYSISEPIDDPQNPTNFNQEIKDTMKSFDERLKKLEDEWSK